MKIALIIGSHRKQSQSARVAEYLAEKLQAKGHETYSVDLGKNPLPLWNEDQWQNKAPWDTVWAPIAAELQTCDGVIVIAPEYGGMAPAALKNFFTIATGKELGHKAGLLVGISASINGAYPISELRESSYKNTKICYLPDHLIIRHVGEVLHGDVKDTFAENDVYIRERIEYTLNVFLEYTKALNNVRASGVTATEKFAFGM